MFEMILVRIVETIVNGLTNLILEVLDRITLIVNGYNPEDKDKKEKNTQIK